MRFGTRFGVAVALGLTALSPLSAHGQQVPTPVIVTVDPPFAEPLLELTPVTVGTAGALV